MLAPCFPFRDSDHLIPLDVTTVPAQAGTCGSPDENRLAIAFFIRDAMEVYLDASLKLGYEASSLHDPLTLTTICASNS